MKKCEECRNLKCEIKVKEIIFYEILGKLLVCDSKALYGMMCRKHYKELNQIGVTIPATKSVRLVK